GRRRWTFFDNAFHVIKKQLECRNIVPLDLTKKTRQLISRRWEIATSASIKQSLEKGTESRKLQKLKLNSSIRSELEAGKILQKKGCRARLFRRFIRRTVTAV